MPLSLDAIYHSFKNMSDQEWDQIMLVHLKGSYSCAKAAWPIFQKQGFGRIVNTASAAGLYGQSVVRNRSRWESHNISR